MEITIQHEEEKHLLKRKDYRVRVFHGAATPSREKLIEQLIGTLHAKKECIALHKVAAEFGSASSIIDVSVYASKEALEQFEPAYMKKRHGAKEAAAEGAAGGA